ncbi:hypothetical protein C8Q76DRAFT_708294 [Earliella scabrosa]|nr:hypothetical protein C8Q76DRAFT_708294 [Earliella scabrosa]
MCAFWDSRRRLSSALRSQHCRLATRDGQRTARVLFKLRARPNQNTAADSRAVRRTGQSCESRAACRAVRLATSARAYRMSGGVPGPCAVSCASAGEHADTPIDVVVANPLVHLGCMSLGPAARRSSFSMRPRTSVPASDSISLTETWTGPSPSLSQQMAEVCARQSACCRLVCSVPALEGPSAALYSESRASARHLLLLPFHSRCSSCSHATAVALALTITYITEDRPSMLRFIPPGASISAEFQ